MASFSGAVSFLLAGRTQLLGRVHSVNKENNVYKDAIGVKGLGVCIRHTVRILLIPDIAHYKRSTTVSC